MKTGPFTKRFAVGVGAVAVVLVVSVVVGALYSHFYEDETFWCDRTYLDVRSGAIREDRYRLFLGPFQAQRETAYSRCVVAQMGAGRSADWEWINTKASYGLLNTLRYHPRHGGVRVRLRMLMEVIEWAGVSEEDKRVFVMRVQGHLEKREFEAVDVLVREYCDELMSAQ